MENGTAPTDVAVTIVGAGFSGLYLLHRMRELGLSTRVFEAGSDVGGTWYWNRYPGARCDVESLEYAYSFLPELETEWRWTERFASQGEIHSYLRHVADRLGLRAGITFETRVTAARWDEDGKTWTVTTNTGEVVRSRHLAMASGPLSAPIRPRFPGIDTFKGESYHTGQWPKEPVSFAGKRVAVIGTGSSGVQVIPEIAKTAGQLFVFQRTAHFSIPARNGPTDEEKRAHWQANFPELRRIAREQSRSGWIPDPPKGSALDATPEEREAEYWRRWRNGGPSFLYAYSDIGSNQAANDTAADFIRARIREIVKDPRTAEILTPRGYPVGAKRITVGTDFYETFNRPNVTLVDAKATPITAIKETGITTTERHFDVDMIVYATGFDALTGALTRIDVRGAGGVSLQEKWAAGPSNYLGVTTSGFPNFTMITGPGSPSVLSNVVTSIEQHVDWVTDLIAWMERNGVVRIEPTEAAEHAWLDHSRTLANATLMQKADSWYVGANIPGKPRVLLAYVGGVDAYRRKCEAVAAAGYEGFAIEHRDLAGTG
jgi:cyclohexanone monooxygenase